MTQMARPGNNARSDQDHRQVVNTKHDTPHVIQGWRQCDHIACCEPVARALLTEYLCERHAAIILVPLVRKRLYDELRIPFDEPVGLGRYDSPAYGWAPGWVFLRCDNSLCGHIWVGRYAWFEACGKCLARVQRSRTAI